MKAEAALSASKRYTDEALKGIGALKGSPCTIKSKEEVEEGLKITFSWLDKDDVEHTETAIVPKGPEGEKGEKGDKGDPGEAVVSFIIVDELPDEGIEGVMYLLQTAEPAPLDRFDEYMYIQGRWEKIGTTGVKVVVENYSTDELLVGTWIDKKPLYRRTFVGSSGETANTWNTVGVIDDLDYGMVANAVLINSFGNYVLIPFSGGTTEEPTHIGAMVQATGNVIVNVSENYTNCVVKITIEYTKKSDTPSTMIKANDSGTNDHTLLVNRDAPDQHPISSITGLSELVDNIYISKLEKKTDYLYFVDFDRIPEYKPLANDGLVGGCTTFVKNYKMYRSYDYLYDETAEFFVRTPKYEGMAYIPGITSGEMKNSQLYQLPHHMVDGVNMYNQKVSIHLLENDFNTQSYFGADALDATKIVSYILDNLITARNKAEILEQLPLLQKIKYPESMVSDNKVVQVFIYSSDADKSFIFTPKADDYGMDIQVADYPKMTNFAYYGAEQVTYDDIPYQIHGQGKERYNMITNETTLEDLKFSKCYEEPTRLSEFIGMGETDKNSTEAQLMVQYNIAKEAYQRYERDGSTWRSIHAIVYGDFMAEELYSQEDYSYNFLDEGGFTEEPLYKDRTYDELETQSKKIINAINEIGKMKNTKFRGYVSLDEPTGYIGNGEFWLQDDEMPMIFPINVRVYNAGQWGEETQIYDVTSFDLWADLNTGHGYYWFGNEWHQVDTGEVEIDNVTIGKNVADLLEVKDGGLELKKFANQGEANKGKTIVVNDHGDFELGTGGAGNILYKIVRDDENIWIMDEKGENRVLYDEVEKNKENALYVDSNYKYYRLFVGSNEDSSGQTPMFFICADGSSIMDSQIMFGSELMVVAPNSEGYAYAYGGEMLRNVIKKDSETHLITKAVDVDGYVYEVMSGQGISNVLRHEQGLELIDGRKGVDEIRDLFIKKTKVTATDENGFFVPQLSAQQVKDAVEDYINGKRDVFYFTKTDSSNEIYCEVSGAWKTLYASEPDYSVQLNCLGEYFADDFDSMHPYNIVYSSLFGEVYHKVCPLMLFRHVVSIKRSATQNAVYASSVIINHKPKMSLDDVKTYLANNGYISSNKTYPCSGVLGSTNYYAATSSGGSPTSQVAIAMPCNGIFVAGSIYATTRTGSATEIEDERIVISDECLD